MPIGLGLVLLQSFCKGALSAEAFLAGRRGLNSDRAPICHETATELVVWMTGGFERQSLRCNLERAGATVRSSTGVHNGLQPLQAPGHLALHRHALTDHRGIT